MGEVPSGTDTLEVENLIARLERQDALTGKISPYPSCPVCAERMTKVNFAKVSGIMIYKCNIHGAWADKNEGIRLLKLSLAGGKEVMAAKRLRYESEERNCQISKLRITGKTRTVGVSDPLGGDAALWYIGWHRFWFLP